MANDYDKILKDEEKRARARQEAFAASQNQLTQGTIDQMNRAYDTAAGAVREQMEASKQGVEGQYANLLDYNAVQQAVNEKKVAEAMANMGLTDAGLNRSQQTALALQRGNADADTRAARQAAVDAIDQQITQYLSEIEATKAQTAAEAWQSAGQNILKNEQELLAAARQSADAQYQALLEQEAEQEKARIQSLENELKDKNEWTKEANDFWQSMYKANLTVMPSADAAALADKQTKQRFGTSYGSGSGGSLWNTIGKVLAGGGTASGGSTASGDSGSTTGKVDQDKIGRSKAVMVINGPGSEEQKAKQLIDYFLNGVISESLLDEMVSAAGLDGGTIQKAASEMLLSQTKK